MLSPVPVVSRRRVLADGGRGLIALALLGATASACGSTPPPAVDQLQAQLDLARRDSAMAAAAATAATAAIAPALTVVASERSRHATALANEIARAAGKPAPSSTEATSASAPPPPALRDVVTALRGSASSAAQLAATESGYRAGLLGSIAASCTTAYTVALVFPEPTQ